MLPNLIIIGAMKCGTTSLHYYLGLHPQIQMSSIKELDFFVEHLNWRRGVEWYQSHFTGDALVHGEASQNYTNYPHFGGVPARMHSLISNVKLIYIIRDPIERITSHYVHNVSHGLEKRDIILALTGPERWQYIDRSKYYMQLEQYLQYFPYSNVLVLKQEELYAQRAKTLKTVFRFLNVNDSFHSPEISKIINPSTTRRRKNWLGAQFARLNELDIVKRIPYDFRVPIGRMLYVPFSSAIRKPELPDWLRQELKDHLQEDADCLRQFTGMSLGDWNL